MPRTPQTEEMGPLTALILLAVASFPTAPAASATVLAALQPLAAADSGAASLIGGTPVGRSVITQSTQTNDFSYWSAETAPVGVMETKTPLDVFGSATDAANAATATIGASDMASPGGDLAITLNHDGLNVITLAIPDRAAIGAVTIAAAPGVTPNAAVIDVTASDLDLSRWTFNAGPLDASQVLIKFPTGSASSLRALASPKGIAPLAMIDYVPEMIRAAPIADEMLTGLGLDKVVTPPPAKGAPLGPKGGSVALPLAIGLGGGLAAIFVAWRLFAGAARRAGS